jgi:PKD repeat protein
MKKILSVSFFLLMPFFGFSQSITNSKISDANIKKYVAFDPKKNLLIYSSPKSYATVYNYLVQKSQSIQLVGQQDSLSLRDNVFVTFERSVATSYNSFDAKVVQEEANAEKAGIKEPKSGYLFDKGFVDDVMRVMMNEQRCFKINKILYKYINPDILLEVYDPNNSIEVYQDLIRIEKADNIKMKGVIIHDFKKSLRLYNDSKYAVEEKSPLSFSKGAAGQEDSDIDCDVTLRHELVSCNTLKFTATPYIDSSDPVTTSNKFIFEVVQNSTGTAPIAISPLQTVPHPNEANWTYTFNSDGEYTIRVRMSNSICPQEDKTTVYEIPVIIASPKIDFSFQAEECSPKTIVFSSNVEINMQGDAVSSYSWRFKQGSTILGTSVQTNPTFIFPADGTYQVCLSIATVNGCVKEKCNTIMVSSQCTAKFKKPEHIKICKPADCASISVDFLNQSSGGVCPISYKWDFGDGTTSTQKSPNHHFNGCGNYTVKLTMKDANNCISVATQDLKLFPMEPVPDFTWDICPNGRVRFSSNLPKNCATLGILNCYPKWNFDNADVSWYKTYNFLYPEHPIAFYSKPGTYKIGMTYMNTEGIECSITKTIIISEIQCCAKNDRNVVVDNWGAEHKCKAVFAITNTLFTHRIVVKTKLKKKGFLGIYYPKKAKEIMAGFEGTIHKADGNWWEVNVERTKCNCKVPETIPYTQTFNNNFKKAVKVYGLGGSGIFSVRQNQIKSSHYIKRIDGSTWNYNLSLGNDCDWNN